MGCCGSFGFKRLTPSRLKPVPTGVRGVFVGLALAGKARFDAINFAVWRLTLSRLKPVPQGYAVFS